MNQFTNKNIFLMMPAEEMRYPYEQSIKNLSLNLTWLTSFLELLNKPKTVLADVIVVDLDLLKKPYEDKLEKIRSNFPQSDLIGLSSSDSAQLALLCIRSGFSDFLLKPTSPEELTWGIKKSLQKHELLKKFEDPKTSMIRAISQLSGCTSATLLRLCTLEFLQTSFSADLAIWADFENKKKPLIMCSIPKEIADKKAKELLKHVFSNKKNSVDKNTITFEIPNRNELIILNGKKINTAKKLIRHHQPIIEHSEICLSNISKFEDVKQQTFIDDLTGLYNSRYLKFALNKAILKCKQPNSLFSLLFIDIDHFKSVNDKNNHLVGSEFLVAIAKTIRNNVRGVDPVFRYGGDEFVVILHDTDSTGAFEIAERIRKHVERRIFSIQGTSLSTTVSIGIASYPEHTKDQETLLKLADEAMYSAKKGKRNTIRLAIGLKVATKTG